MILFTSIVLGSHNVFPINHFMIETSIPFPFPFVSIDPSCQIATARQIVSVWQIDGVWQIISVQQMFSVWQNISVQQIFKVWQIINVQ